MWTLAEVRILEMLKSLSADNVDVGRSPYPRSVEKLIGGKSCHRDVLKTKSAERHVLEVLKIKSTKGHVLDVQKSKSLDNVDVGEGHILKVLRS